MIYLKFVCGTIDTKHEVNGGRPDGASLLKDKKFNEFLTYELIFKEPKLNEVE